MPSDKPFSGYFFFLVKDNLSQKSVKRHVVKIMSMGGTMEAATRALYILVPHRTNNVVLDIAPGQPSAVVLDELFVFDCLRFGRFQDFDKYTCEVHTAELGTPTALATTLAGHSTPLNNDGSAKSPSDDTSTSRAPTPPTPPSPPFNRYFPTFKSPFQPKRQRDEAEAQSEIEESRNRVRGSMSKRWKEKTAKAVKPSILSIRGGVGGGGGVP